jgi:putative glutamine amidotransferase
LVPVIGITATVRQDVDTVAQRPLGRFVRADLDYVEGIFEAGGMPVVLPPLGDSGSIQGLLDGMDGLVLSGGSDLHPGYYGEETVPELGPTVPERDAFEMRLLGYALRRGIPVLGICRGMQVLNVALGGTLFQDLPSQMDHLVLLGHRQETPKWEPTHEVGVDRGSQVAEIMGTEELKVNSYHHQAIKDLAHGLVAVAHAPDGVVEAVEWGDLSQRWLVGVQWHAEAMRGTSPAHGNLFEAHVYAAKRRALCRAAA